MMRTLTILFLLFSFSCSKGQGVDAGTGKPGRASVISVSAGADQPLAEGSTSTTLTGTASAASGIEIYAWTRISGPNTPTIVSASSASTSVTGMIVGTYVFRLTVTAGNGQTAYDEVNVVIPSSPYDDTVFVYIVAGQSNAEGRVSDSMPYWDVQRRIPGVQIFNWPDRTMRPLESDRYNGNEFTGSLNWGFGDYVTKKIFDSLRGGTGDSVVLFKTTKGSTSLAPLTASNGHWIIPQDSTASGKWKMVDSLTNRWGAFKQMWLSRGYYVKPVCIMWHQGEADNTNVSPYYAAGAYYTRFNNLITELRDLFENEDLFVYVGGISTGSIYYNSTVEAAKQGWVTADGNAYYINMDGQPLKVDNTHFGATGQIYLANQIYTHLKSQPWAR